MFRTLALSAIAAAGLLLLPGQASTTRAAPTIAPKIATPENAVEQVRRRGGGGFHGGRSFRGHSFRSGRGWGGRRFYGGHGYSRRWAHRHHHHHHRHRHGWRRGIIIGAGFPFFYGGYGYYGGCGYYYRKWMRTGSRYWRNRYYDCRYW